MLRKFSDVLLESTMDKYRKESEAYLKKLYPKYVIVYDDSDFAEDHVYKRKGYKIYIAGAETASGKDAIRYNIEFI